MKLSLPGQRVAQKITLRSRDHLRQRQQPKGRLVEKRWVATLQKDPWRLQNDPT